MAIGQDNSDNGRGYGYTLYDYAERGSNSKYPSWKDGKPNLQTFLTALNQSNPISQCQFELVWSRWPRTIFFAKGITIPGISVNIIDINHAGFTIPIPTHVTYESTEVTMNIIADKEGFHYYDLRNMVLQTAHPLVAGDPRATIGNPYEISPNEDRIEVRLRNRPEDETHHHWIIHNFHPTGIGDLELGVDSAGFVEFELKGTFTHISYDCGHMEEITPPPSEKPQSEETENETPEENEEPTDEKEPDADEEKEKEEEEKEEEGDSDYYEEEEWEHDIENEDQDEDEEEYEFGPLDDSLDDVPEPDETLDEEDIWMEWNNDDWGMDADEYAISGTQSEIDTDHGTVSFETNTAAPISEEGALGDDTQTREEAKEITQKMNDAQKETDKEWEELVSMLDEKPEQQQQQQEGGQSTPETDSGKDSEWEELVSMFDEKPGEQGQQQSQQNNGGSQDEEEYRFGELDDNGNFVDADDEDPPKKYTMTVGNKTFSASSRVELYDQVANADGQNTVLKSHYRRAAELLRNGEPTKQEQKQARSPSKRGFSGEEVEISKMTMNQIRQLNSLVKAIRSNHDVPTGNFRLVVSPKKEMEEYKCKIAKMHLPHRFGMYKTLKHNALYDKSIKLEEPRLAPVSSENSNHKIRPIFPV